METVQLISDKEKRYMSLTHEVFSVQLILIIFTEPSYSLVSIETLNVATNVCKELKRSSLSLTKKQF
jgi:hypothetical protein